MVRISDPRLADCFYIGLTALATAQKALSLNVPAVASAAKVVTPDNYTMVVESLNIIQHTAAGNVTLQITNGTTTFNVLEIGFSAAEASVQLVDGEQFHLIVPNGYWLTGATTVDTCDVVAMVRYVKGGSFS